MPFMASPERFLSFPVFVEERQTVSSNKLNRSLHIPKVAKIDIENIFHGSSLCLLDHLSAMADGGPAVPEFIIYTAKDGVYSEPSGRKCHFTQTCKTVILEKPSNDPATSSARPSPFGGSTHTALSQLVEEECAPAQSISDIDDDELSDDDPAVWGFSQESEEEQEAEEADEDRALAKFMNTRGDDRHDITRKFAAYVDVRKYYVFVSAKTNQLSAIWKGREKRKNWSEYKRATKKLKALVPRPGTLYASFTIKMSREKNWTQCAEKARVWQQWHSSI